MPILPILAFLGAMFSPDREAYMDPEDVMDRHGYDNVETHLVEAADGYRLPMWRLPPASFPSRGPLLLLHGMMEDGADWIVLKTRKNLPYMLVEEGFEVWILNGRGSHYAMEQNHLMTDDPENPVWNFSLPHIARTDVPAVFNYILKRQEKPHQKQMFVVTYSLSSKLMYLALKLRAELSKKIKAMVNIAPAIYVAWNNGKMTRDDARRISSLPWKVHQEQYERSGPSMKTWLRSFGRSSGVSLGSPQDLADTFKPEPKVNGTSKFVFAPPPTPKFRELFLYGTEDRIATPDQVERALFDLRGAGHEVLACRIRMLDHFGLQHARNVDRLVFEPVLTFFVQNYVQTLSQRSCSYTPLPKFKHGRERDQF